MQKLKEERREEANSRHEYLFVVQIATKAPLHPHCRSTHEEYRFRQSSLFREHNHGHLDLAFH